MALRVVDRALQAHGGAGVSQDTPLARMYSGLRTLRLADGPDEVHRRTVARSVGGQACGGRLSTWRLDHSYDKGVGVRRGGQT